MPPKKTATKRASSPPNLPNKKNRNEFKPQNPSDEPVIDTPGKRTIGINTISKPPSRSDPNKPQYGWVLSDEAKGTFEYKQRQEEEAKKYENQLVTPELRALQMVSRFFTRLNGSPADKYMTPEQQSGLIRQALSLTSKSSKTPSPSIISSSADPNQKTKDASTSIDYLEMFRKPIEANFAKNIPNTIARCIFTKPTTPLSEAYTEEMLEQLRLHESIESWSLSDYLSKLEPKDKVQFTYALKWEILKKIETGTSRADMAKKYGCKSEDIGRWIKESALIKKYAEDPATANAMRIR